jgi:hypothetical protein
MPNLGKHWQYAAAATLARLEEITYSFDFKREAGSANCVGITPQFFVEIIDGFLTEGEDVVPQGNRRDLIESRHFLTSRVQQAFDEGLAAGKAAYEGSPKLHDSWDTELIRNLAAGAAPADDKLRGWFMEGFCYAWTLANLENVKKQHSG